MIDEAMTDTEKEVTEAETEEVSINKETEVTEVTTKKAIAVSPKKI